MATVDAIYTDGACSGNPGPGGWGTRIEFTDGQVHELGGRDGATTNNRMEMQAAISALEFLHNAAVEAAVESTHITLHTDSEYLKNGITKWIKGWKRKGWKTSAGKAVLNKDLWQQLDAVAQSLIEKDLTIDWRYVRGHTGNPGNERCDEIASAFSRGQSIGLKQNATLKKETKSARKTGESAATNQKSINLSAIILETNADTAQTNVGTTEEPSLTPALRSYETPQEGQPDMASSDSKSDNPYEGGRVQRLKNALETLQVTDELAKQGYLITSAELADLMDVNASAVTSRGDYWAWRNWTVSRIRREGNQILWQLERIDE
ncbi:MAG: ribonuclease HI [Phormidesmis sp.]